MIFQELGIVNRAIANTLVRFVGTMVPNTHFSFGDADGKPNQEFPHAVGPLFSTIDRLVVTPPGVKPPSLGETLCIQAPLWLSYAHFYP